MNRYLVTVFNADLRIERSVIAPSTTAAIRIGIRMMPELQGPFRITGKVAASSQKSRTTNNLNRNMEAA